MSQISGGIILNHPCNVTSELEGIALMYSKTVGLGGNQTNFAPYSSMRLELISKILLLGLLVTITSGILLICYEIL